MALARDEREVNAVFDVIEPFAAKLAATGRPPFRRHAMLRLIGQALLAQHRVSGRVAVEEKPDVLGTTPSSNASTRAWRTNASSASAPTS